MYKINNNKGLASQHNLYITLEKYFYKYKEGLEIIINVNKSYMLNYLELFVLILIIIDLLKSTKHGDIITVCDHPILDVNISKVGTTIKKNISVSGVNESSVIPILQEISSLIDFDIITSTIDNAIVGYSLIKQGYIQD